MPHSLQHNHFYKRQGAVLMLMLTILVIGAAALLVGSLSRSAAQIERDQKTADALAQAKEALIGYAVTYRDNNHPNEVWGYLPLPDLGSSRNGTTQEGNAAANFSGNTKNLTVIGRFPWRTLGLPPLRDGQGGCLWYAVSGSFQNTQKADVLNWDSLGHFDVYSSNGISSGTVSTTGGDYVQHPVAIIFSANAVLQKQDRQASTTDTVSTCGGNYDARNYLDSFNTDANINNIVNYFAGSTNNSTGYAYNLINTSNGSQLTSTDLSAPKNIIFGDIEVLNAGQSVKIVNNRILAITADDIFRPIIRRSDFSAQIYALMGDAAFVTHLQAVLIAGTKGTDKIDCTKTSNTVNKSFCDNWKEMLLLTQLSTPAPITLDGASTTNCSRILIFGGQKNATQLRLTAANKASPSNYIEGVNLSAFATPVAVASNFIGVSVFSSKNPSADVLKCLS